MFGELHDLRHEFPEYNDRIHALKIKSDHFRRLFDEYDELAHELVRIQQNIETPSDEVVEGLKLKRLNLKDKLYAMLQRK
ncbi:MAG: GTP-binding protein [Gammaproteobacteria bacterium]|nr:MAG: GTP-binding protein [Gammaproteobacteria bacterium]